MSEPTINGYTPDEEIKTEVEMDFDDKEYQEIFKTFGLRQFVPLSPCPSPIKIKNFEHVKTLNEDVQNEQAFPLSADQCVTTFPPLSQICNAVPSTELNEPSVNVSYCGKLDSTFKARTFLDKNIVKTQSDEKKTDQNFQNTNAVTHDFKNSQEVKLDNKIKIQSMLVPKQNIMGNVEIKDCNNIFAYMENCSELKHDVIVGANGLDVEHKSDLSINEDKKLKPYSGLNSSNLGDLLNSPISLIKVEPEDNHIDSHLVTNTTRSPQGQKRKKMFTLNAENNKQHTYSAVNPSNKLLRCDAINEALEALESLIVNKTKLNIQNVRHKLKSALLNPANVQNATQAVIIIINHLKNSQISPLTDFVKAKGDINVLMPITEYYLVKCLHEVAKKNRPYLSDLIPIFDQYVLNSIMEIPTEEVSMHLNGLMAFCRVYAASIKLNLEIGQQVECAWELCLKLTKKKHIEYFHFVSASILSMWSDIWSSMRLEDYDLVQQLLLKFMLTKCNNPNHEIWHQRTDLCLKAIQMIFKVHPEEIKLENILMQLMEKVKSCEPNCLSYYIDGLTLGLQFNIQHIADLVMEKVKSIIKGPELYPQLNIDALRNFYDRICEQEKRPGNFQDSESFSILNSVPQKVPANWSTCDVVIVDKRR